MLESTFSNKRVLHVGCGGQSLPAWFDSAVEIRMDIDQQHKPDIVADMRNFGDIGKYDVIYTSHALEHLYPHEVAKTLRNFKGALNEGGCIIAIVPNLEGITATDDVLYESPGGPITGRDMIYGKLSLIEKMPYMAHHTGFVASTLRAEFEQAGFENVVVKDDKAFNLIAVAVL